jgi:hypothetical protein
MCIIMVFFVNLFYFNSIIQQFLVILMFVNNLNLGHNQYIHLINLILILFEELNNNISIHIWVKIDHITEL